VRGYIDARQEAAEAALREFGGDYAATDPERALNDASVDAVFICTWHDTHRPLAVAAAEAGKHILIEKPLALTVEDARAIEETVNRAGVTLVVGHKLRHAPVVRAVQELIPQPRILMGQVMDNRWPDDAWFSQPVVGGANVLSQGCHIVDLLHALAGADPVWVAAGGGAMTHPGSENVDQAVATIRYANGAVASAVLGDAGVNPVTSKFFAQVWDAKGKGACLHERCRRADLWGTEPSVLQAAELSPDGEQDPEGDRALLQAFVQAVREGGTALPGAREGRITTQTMEAIVRSIRTGAAQEIRSYDEVR
jgi:1,5-anhydro-D-fructose reductase (1,5-anhydro-D-mannitol-forming)